MVAVAVIFSIYLNSVLYFKVDRTMFYKFKLTKVHINLNSGYFGLVNKFPTPNYGWRKQSE